MFFSQLYVFNILNVIIISISNTSYCVKQCRLYFLLVGMLAQWLPYLTHNQRRDCIAVMGLVSTPSLGLSVLQVAKTGINGFRHWLEGTTSLEPIIRREKYLILLFFMY